MNQQEYVKTALGTFHNISEVELKYLNDNKTTYSLSDKSSREAVIAQLLTQVDWDTVDEVEFKIVKGKKKKVDLVEYREEFVQPAEQIAQEAPEIVEASESESSSVTLPVIIPFNKSRSAAASRRAKVLDIPKRNGTRANIQSRSKARSGTSRKRK